jgi:hypothetical protein
MWRGSRRCRGLGESDNDARVWVIGSAAVAAFPVTALAGGRQRWKWREEEGERGRPGLHSERARDVETLVGHALHAVARLCARSATTLTERY